MSAASEPQSSAASPSDSGSQFVCSQEHPSYTCDIDPDGPGGDAGVVLSCHCGSVHLQVVSLPDEVSECKCSICGRLATRWAYYASGEVAVRGATDTYVRKSDKPNFVAFHRCKHCGCTTHWARLVSDERIPSFGVNSRLLSPQVQEQLRVRVLEGPK